MDNQNYEKKIGYLIHENMKIEWMRFNMYIESDIYASIPMLVFRIYDEEEARIERIKEYILEFKGHNRWSLFISPLTRKKNYILSLDIVEKMYNDVADGALSDFAPRTIWGEDKYRKVCFDAVQEIPDLAQYLEEFFIKKPS